MKFQDEQKKLVNDYVAVHDRVSFEFLCEAWKLISWNETSRLSILFQRVHQKFSWNPWTNIFIIIIMIKLEHKINLKQWTETKKIIKMMSKTAEIKSTKFVFWFQFNKLFILWHWTSVFELSEKSMKYKNEKLTKCHKSWEISVLLPLPTKSTSITTTSETTSSVTPTTSPSATW